MPTWQEVAAADTVFAVAPPGGSRTGGSGGEGEQPAAGDDAPRAWTLNSITGFVRVYDLGESHKLVLTNATGLPGQNLILGHLRPPAPGLSSIFEQPAIRTEAPVVRPDDDWLADKLTSLFPDYDERTDVQDAAGPYGRYQYVILRYADAPASCLFAWQILRKATSRVPLPAGLSEVYIQMRYCSVDRAVESRLPQAFQRVRVDFLPTYRGEREGVSPGRWGADRRGTGAPYHWDDTYYPVYPVE